MAFSEAPLQAYSAFISHASPDSAKSQEICDELEKAGFRCWIAPRDVRPGEVYLEEIIHGIENCKCMVLILSSHANKSPFVRNEVERAYSKGKPLFPVRIEDVRPSRGLELLVSTAHWIDAWRGGVAGPVAQLVARLAENPDVGAELPPELQTRIRWRRRLRTASLLASAIVIAVSVGLVMRTAPLAPPPAVAPPAVQAPAAPQAQKPEKQVYTSPPSIFLTGSLALPNRPITVSALLQSGYNQDGLLDIFDTPVSLSVFDVTPERSAQVFRSKPDKFNGVFRSTSVQNIVIPHLPLRAVFCLNYTEKSSGQNKATLAGFTLTPPQMQVSGVGIQAFAGAESVAASSPEECGPLVKAYAARHLKGVKPLVVDSTAAGREEAFPWSGQCWRDRENPALLSCYLYGGVINTDVQRVAAGFQRDDLPFSAETTSGDPRGQGANAFYLPNLGQRVFAAKLYTDGSKSAARELAVAASDPRPPLTSITSDSAGAPRLYVGYDPHYLPRWGVISMGDASQMSWSRDGQGYTDLLKHGNSFSALITPRAIGIDSRTSPPILDPRSLWIRVAAADGSNNTYRYTVDLWSLARQALRTLQPIESSIDCATETLSTAHGTSGVASRFKTGRQAAPGFLFRRISAGTTEGTLTELTTSWRTCGPTPIPGRCTRALFLAPSDASTVFFQFEYWDGVVTPVFATPVR